jgi:rod shape-determining protein MreC
VALSTRRSGRTRFTILLLVLTAVTLLTLDGRGFGPIDSARSAILSALSPVGDAASAVVEPIGNAWDSAFRESDLQTENDELRERIERLEGDVLAGEAAQQQLRQVLELVGLTFNGDNPVVHTRVVAGSVSNFTDTLDLDKGSSSGIAEGMAVVTGKGLIGKVVQVSADRSTVELVTSGNYQVGFVAVDTAAVGTARGIGSPDVLLGTGIDSTAKVEVGQILLTGADGSSYPPGLPIGTITAMQTDAAARETTVDIELLADTTNLTYADVVLYPATAPVP